MKNRVTFFGSLLVIFLIHFSSLTLYGKTIIVPDEFSTIQSAINAAILHDTVLVKPGSYHEFLVLKDSIVLMSEGDDNENWERASRTIIHSDGLRDTSGNITPVVNCADGSVLDGFEITGMDTVNHHLPGHSHAVQNRGTSSTIKNCIVHDNGSTGIGSHEKDGQPAVPAIIHNKVYKNFGIGIGFNHFSKGVANNNLVYNNREVGIGVQNGASPLVENNVIYGNGWNGISVRDGSKPIIKNNLVYSNGTDRTGSEMPFGAGTGIGADSTGWLVKPEDTIGPMLIENNTVYDNPSGGIMVRNKAMVKMVGNSSYNNYNFQASISDSSEGEIDGNDFYQNSDSRYNAGGVVVSKSGKATFKKNWISKVDLAGILVGDEAQVDILDNDIIDCKLTGIRIDSTSKPITIRGNRLNDNQSIGILIKGATVDISRNLLTNNFNGGISCDSASSSHIYNNTVIHGTNTGRGIVASTKETKVYNNIVMGYAIGIFRSNEAVIDYNCTYNNTGYNGPPGTGGAHAIGLYPEFVDTTNADFHLKSNSPCINAGNMDVIYNDPDGSIADIGCFPYEEPSDIKSFNDNEYGEFNFSTDSRSGQILITVTGELINKLPLNVEIYNILGMKIDELQLKNSQISLNVNTLSTGTYFFKLSGVPVYPVQKAILIR